MTSRLAFALDLVHRAGRGTLGHFQAGVSVETKADESPVTIADREAEALIRREIAVAYPGEAILGEEEGESGSSSARWVVDPIDGTKSFVCGVPLYATLLAFEVDSVVQLGIAYFPALGEMIYAEVGGGAFCNGRPCRVSPKTRVAGSVLACGGLQSMHTHGRLEGFLKLGDRAMATRTWSDAYGHALVATGRVEAMVDPVVNYWDVAPISLIVREAGGAFSDFSGGLPFAGEAVSSNGLVHDELLEAFRR
jgi:histidinol-phosphatase